MDRFFEKYFHLNKNIGLREQLLDLVFYIRKLFLTNFLNLVTLILILHTQN